MSKEDLLYIFKIFVGWRISLFLFSLLAVNLIQNQSIFLGGGLHNYLSNPYFWGWLNFDGEHYLAIAQYGYRSLTYFYFPLFPILVRLVVFLYKSNTLILAIGGLLLNHLFLLIGLIGFWKLIKLDSTYDVKTVILLLLLFPTSFFFASYYTEGIFFALSVWAFFFARKKIWWAAGLLGLMSTFTRLIGIALFPAMIAEYSFSGSKKFRSVSINKNIIFLLLIPLGLFTYMLFVKYKTGDPFEFLHSVEIFGEQRSSNFVFLPQVFYRYIFKILPSLNYQYFPAVFFTGMEFFTGVLFLFLSILGLVKLRLSYAIFLILGYVIPTLSGSFSSLPRYVIVLFPAFILMGLYFHKMHKIEQIIIITIFFLSLAIATMLFIRGYWIA